MARLIDADELLRRYDEEHEGPPGKARKLIEEAPTVEKKALDQRVCKNCHYRSDDFTSVCVNGESEHCADFVSEDDRCEKWEEKDAGQ